MNVNNQKQTMVKSFVLLVIGLLSLSLMSGFAHATDVEDNESITSTLGKNIVTVVDANGNVQVNCNSLNKYDRFKCYEEVAKRKRESQNKENETKNESNRPVREMMRNLGQEIKDQCEEKRGKDRVECVDAQIIKKRLGVAVVAGARLDGAFEKLSEDKEKMFKENMRGKFGSEENARNEFQRLLKQYNEKSDKLRELHDRINLLRVKASLTAEEKAEFGAKLDNAFVKGVEARIDVAHELETQGADSAKVSAVVTLLQNEIVKFNATNSTVEKKAIVKETNDAWQTFKQDISKSFFTAKIEAQAFKIKSVLEKADNTTAQLKVNGTDVSKLEAISVKAHAQVEAALEANITLNNAAWHLAKARVWTNYYLQSINRVVNGKTLEREPSDEQEVEVENHSEVRVNTDDDSTEVETSSNTTVSASDDSNSSDVVEDNE